MTATMNVYCILIFYLVNGGLGKPADVFLEYKDSIGQYSFGYSSLDSARSEIRSADGKTRGAFSYVDDSGVIQSARYTADSENGFRIEATNLPTAPEPIEDTPEVKAAREEHFRAYEKAMKLAEMYQSEPEVRIIAESRKSNVDEMKIEEVAKKKSDISKQITKESQKKGILPKMADSAKSEVFEGKTTKDYGVPVVKTSFIMPGGNLNHHSRIELQSTEQAPSPSARVSQGYHGGIEYETKSSRDGGVTANIYTSATSYSPILYSAYLKPHHPFTYNYNPFILPYTHYY